MTPDDLHARRLSLGMTQAQLASALGATPNTVARWERGELKIERPETLALALEALEARQ